jgi:predicted AlkP superfamily pyrophosphatase or phosphodiesterase
LIISTLLLFSCNKEIVSSIEKSENHPSVLQKPYLILISLDGFRWDYVERFNPPHLKKFIQSGVQAASLIPSFPSKTFPNHYTIATGLYPENHGLLSNRFYSYEKDKTYKLSDRSVVEDGTWYGGTPIWVQAAKAGMVTASYFFVGTEAAIQDIRPNYYYNYDGKVKNEARVTQALEWLDMPAEKRPHVITMYFSDMDNIGHSYGPNNDAKLKEGLFELDKVLGDLFKGVAQRDLPVNIIIVSDHGMMETPLENYIPVEKVQEEELYFTINNGAMVNIHPKVASQTDSIYHFLKKKEANFKVYKTADTPQFEYTAKNKNWGAIQVIPDKGYYFVPLRTINFQKSNTNQIFGQHGFDPEYKDLHGIFYANGPAFKKGYQHPSIKNIHIYPIMCQLLGLPIPKDIDGKLAEGIDMLK